MFLALTVVVFVQRKKYENYVSVLGHIDISLFSFVRFVNVKFTLFFVNFTLFLSILLFSPVNLALEYGKGAFLSVNLEFLAQFGYSDCLLSAVCPTVSLYTFHIPILSKITGPIATKFA